MSNDRRSIASIYEPHTAHPINKVKRYKGSRKGHVLAESEKKGKNKCKGREENKTSEYLRITDMTREERHCSSRRVRASLNRQ